MVGDDLTQRTEVGGEAASLATADLVGRSLLHFHVTDRLGEGGMGIVYRAIDLKLARRVALKVLGRSLQADEASQRLLLREARSAAALVHPNIAAIHEVHDGPPAFYAMELVEGETLRQRIASKGKLPVTDASAFAVQIADALACAHDKNIVHRDLKTDNVMITPSGRVKLLDFGVAKVVGLAEPAASRDSQPEFAETVRAVGTELGAVIGTPAYMSPEQARGEEVDARSDVFSFGVVLYELFSGTQPFVHRLGIPSSDPSSRDWKIIEPPSLLPGVPPQTAAVIARCLSLDRSERYANGAELAQALAVPASRWRAKTTWAAAGVLLAVGSATATAAYVTSTRTTEIPRDTCVGQVAALDAALAGLTTNGGHAVSTDDAVLFRGFAARWKDVQRAACERAERPGDQALARGQLQCLGDAANRFTAAVADVSVAAFRPWRPPLPSLERCVGEGLPEAPKETSLYVEVTPQLDDHTLSPDGTLLANTESDHLSVRRIGSGNMVAYLPVPPGSSVVSWPTARKVWLSTPELMIADLDRGDLTPVAGVRAEERWTDFGSSGAYVVARDGDMLQIVSLADGKRSSPFSIDTYMLGAWSPRDEQLALVAHDQLAILSSRASPAVPSVIRLRVPSPFGFSSALWLDDHTLLFTGEASAEDSVGIWMVHARDGRLLDEPVLALPAPRRVTYTLLWSGGGRVLVARALLSQKLVRIVDGRSAVVHEAPELSGLIQIDRTGRHALAAVGIGVDAIDLVDRSSRAVHTDPLGWASYDGDRVISTLGHHLVASRGTDRRNLASVPDGSRIECAAEAPGRCVVWWYVGDGIDLAMLHDDQLGPARHISIENAAWRPDATVSISRDGQRVALTGFPDRVELMDPATGGRETRMLPQSDRCTSAQFSAWGPHGDLYVSTPALCTERASHVYLFSHSGEPRSVFETEDWFTGIAMAPDGTLYATIERSRAELVVVDHLVR